MATRAIPLVFDALLAIRPHRIANSPSSAAVRHWTAGNKRPPPWDWPTRVEFIGRVPHEKFSSYYAAADALVFPALRDSGGSALLEAMSRGLPVICLDWAGPGEMVDETSGIKIPVTDPDRTVGALAEAFVRLRQNPALGKSLAAAAQKRALALFRWDAKYRLLRRSINV